MRLSFPPVHTRRIVVTGGDVSGLTQPQVLGPAVILQGTLAARPAFGVEGRIYIATDVDGGTLYRDTGAAWTQLGAAGGTAAPPLINLLVNGGMEVWQRGAGPFTATGAYGPDRWRNVLTGASTLSVERNALQADTASTYCAACTAVIAAAAPVALYQNLEDYVQLRGRQVSLSIRVRTAVANAVRIEIYDGVTTTLSGFHDGTGAYSTLTVSATVAAAATELRIGVRFDANGTHYVDAAMFVLGATPADYLPLSPADEWGRCLRYYEVIADTGTLSFARAYHPGGSAAASSEDAPFLFRSLKPVAATVTKSGTWNVSNCGQPSVNAADTRGVSIRVVATAANALTFFNPNAAGCSLVAEANP